MKSKVTFSVTSYLPIFKKAVKRVKKEKTKLINIYKALLDSDDNDIGRDL